LHNLEVQEKESTNKNGSLEVFVKLLTPQSVMIEAGSLMMGFTDGVVVERFRGLDRFPLRVLCRFVLQSVRRD
jgi:hypothetical protein